MLIAYIANDDFFKDCVLKTEYGESELKNDKDVLDAVNEWMQFRIDMSDYEDDETIVEINIFDTDTQKVTTKELIAIRRPTFELV